jgi:hypothetical protein
MHSIAIHQCERTNSGSGQKFGCEGTQSTETNDEHTGMGEFQLMIFIEKRQGKMPGELLFRLQTESFFVN